MRANPWHSWPIVNNFFRANNEIVVAFFRAWAYTLFNMKNEIEIYEIETGLFVASVNGKEISHGRTEYQAMQRAKEFLKNN